MLTRQMGEENKRRHQVSSWLVKKSLQVRKVDRQLENEGGQRTIGDLSLGSQDVTAGRSSSNDS